jgi:hypothetical protein
MATLLAALLACGAAAAGSARADDAADPLAYDPERVRVAASERYEANRIHRFALGGGYRDLWQAEVELPVLDPAVQAGGLTPVGRFGGLQTAVLALVNAEGRSFTFRGTDKDPSAVLPADLQDTIIKNLVQDMMAAQHPGGPIPVSVLAEAAGLLAVQEHMVVLKDSPALGEYREEFAGMVGAFYEFPQPAEGARAGFRGAIDVISYKELYERLEAGYDDPVAVDAFLRARLFDILIGDFDRHRKQWRWARFPDDPRWYPIPEDRDMAFVRYEGVGPRVAYIYVPILQDYSDTYPWIKGLTKHGWEQDRWLLPALSWADWERIALDIRSRVTDEVIDDAISRLPAEYQALDGARLRHDLRGRRDHLLEGARAFYEHLAGEVNVEGTNGVDVVSVSSDADGATRVEVRREEGGAPVFSRRFTPDETSDLRIYLRDGDDRVTVTGDHGITVRVIAGGGEKTVDDSAGGGTRVYDEENAVALAPGPGTRMDRRHYEQPPDQPGFVDVEGVPARDWGWDLIPVPLFGYQKDVGAFLGVGAIYTRFGFRKDPWAQRHRVSAGYATEAETGRFAYNGDFRAENSPLLGNLLLSFSGIEVLRWYGFGNGTGDSGNQGFYRAKSAQLRAQPSLEITFDDERVRMKGGPWIEWSRTSTNEGRLIDLQPEYGDGKFGMIGAFANFQLDTRRSISGYDETLVLPLHDNPAAGYPTSGFLFDVTGEVSPPVWDVDKGTWGSVGGSISGFLSVGEKARATLGARIGGRHVFGTQPYFKSAFVGGGEFFSGGSQVRGLRAERFAGDSSLFGNLDLRVFLVRTKIVVPSDIGVFGFGDVGRVWADENKSKKWHPGAGGGVWIAPLARTNAISFSVAKSDEETLFYLRMGFSF